jgi:hypothetical protein
MDLNAIGAFFVTYIVQQWPFFFVAFLLGVAGQVFKMRVWTLERARKKRFFWWMRAFMPFHAPFIGFVVGCVFWSLLKETTPTGPGVNGGGAIILYYTGAGAISSWLYGAFKHVLEFKFGIKPPSELDDIDSLRPPDDVISAAVASTERAPPPNPSSPPPSAPPRDAA